MKVIRAKVLGFCTGVRRAVEMAWAVSKESGFSEAGRVYTFGPLIHNTNVLQSLKERGVTCLEENDIPTAEKNATIIIRAHGISPVIEREIVQQGFTVVDATCPHVKVSQSKARSYAEKGYVLFLAGEEKHAEIEGVRGYAQDGFPVTAIPRCFVVSNPFEAEAAASELHGNQPNAKTALIGQTTIMAEEYRAMAERISRFFPSLEVMDSVCGATQKRQKALLELCAITDAVIVVGSRESANTKRLLSLAKELGKPAWLTESPADIPREIGNYATVGISAGASTPDNLVDEVEKALTCQPD